MHLKRNQMAIVNKAKAFIKDKSQEKTSQEAISTLLEEIKKRRKTGCTATEMETLIDDLQKAMGT